MKLTGIFFSFFSFRFFFFGGGGLLLLLFYHIADNELWSELNVEFLVRPQGRGNYL